MTDPGWQNVSITSCAPGVSPWVPLVLGALLLLVSAVGLSLWKGRKP